MSHFVRVQVKSSRRRKVDYNEMTDFYTGASVLFISDMKKEEKVEE